MKKDYIKPSINSLEFCESDVITTSPIPQPPVEHNVNGSPIMPINPSGSLEDYLKNGM